VLVALASGELLVVYNSMKPHQLLQFSITTTVIVALWVLGWLLIQNKFIPHVDLQMK